MHRHTNGAALVSDGSRNRLSNPPGCVRTEFVPAITASVDTYYMPISVAPGAQVEITVTLTAPTKTGMLRGDWVIFNTANAAFSSFYFEYDIQ